MRIPPGKTGIPAWRSLSIGLLLVVASVFPAVSDSGFSAERAAEHVRVLAVEIGPRKTGTDGARRAVEYIQSEFETIGLQVDLQRVESVTLQPGVEVVARTVNVLGRLQGSRPGTILIGAHFDSRNRMVPGALDDASGVAVVLELARVLAARPPAGTLLFALFGAEEEGCIGSKHFADSADLADFRLVVTLDPVGRGKLFLAPFPDPPALGWNLALRRIAKRLGADRYLFDPLYVLAPRFLRVPFNADHAPFLDHGVPALNLSSQFDLWEYHTRFDRIDRVEPETLAAAGNAVLALIAESESGTLHPRPDPHYLLLRFPGYLWFLSGRLLQTLTAVAILVVLLLGAGQIRKVRIGHFAGLMIRCAISVSFVLAIALSGLFLTEYLAELGTGFRFPWFSRQGISLAMASALAAITTWVAIRLFRRIQPVVDMGPYLAAACLFLMAECAIFLALRLPEIAFLFAPPLLAIGVSSRLQGTWFRILIVGLGFSHLPGLVAPESYRMAIRFAGLELSPLAGFAVLMLLILPLGLFLSGLSCHRDWMRGRFWTGITHTNTLLACVVILLACWGAWYQRSSYDDRHRRTVRVREVVDEESSRAYVEISSQENLRGIHLSGVLDEEIDLGKRRWRMLIEEPPALLRLSFIEESEEEAIRTVRLVVDLDRPANRIRVRFRSPGGFLMPREGREDGEESDWDEVTVPEWRYVFGLSRLEERYQLWPVSPIGPLTVEVEASFEEDLFGLEFQAPHTVFYHRNLVRAVRALR